MAEAPGHLLGQIIGNALEKSVEPLLAEIARDHALFLDQKGPRPARPGLKLAWTDDLGNTHDLDFVLERGGTPYKLGTPAAFIEVAWRRYTKHSRAKAQEIQGALLPLLAKHADVKPFAGAVVAGEWTSGALQQMRSSGFAVLHFSYDDVVAAFAEHGIDVDANERTSDAYLRQQIDKYQGLPQRKKDEIAVSLCRESSESYAEFKRTLVASLGRRVTRVLLLPLRGQQLQFATVADAIVAVRDYDIVSDSADNVFVRFEVQITYSNTDTVFARFEQANDAVAFLESFA